MFLSTNTTFTSLFPTSTGHNEMTSRSRTTISRSASLSSTALPSSQTDVNNLVVIAGVPLAVGTIAIVLLIAICTTCINCYIIRRKRLPRRLVPSKL